MGGAIRTCQGRPTIYRGKRYRSRTEARWAKFFDELHIKHWYEPQKFTLDWCNYVPDFYLPMLRCWVEVKAKAYTDEHIARIKALAEQTQERAFMFTDYNLSPDAGTPYAYGYVWTPDGLYGDHVFAWAKCPICGACDVAHLGLASELPCGCCREWGKVYGDEDAIFIRAFNRAAALK